MEFYTPRKPVIEFNIGKLTVLIIMICLFTYFIEKSYPVTINFLAFGRNDFMNRPWSIITSAFLHANLIHLFYNLLNVFIFGNLLEIRYGSKFLFLLFLFSTIIGNLGFSLFSSNLTIGISGVVFGFIGASVILIPNAKVPLPIGSVSALFKVWFAGPVMAIGELFLSFITFDNIAHSAHFFGFVAGLVIAIWKKMSH
ncbi:MAG: rhomboid family intramembrane serine protease [Candidatus Parvarchaeota archaeon]|nr:rhomboid family intramembrane serine protease [Candidatus Jingweiarchaeum tengchongense]MCW1311114.1 rhomboid family intramembrane serine protease [Candidatus Jingweiarchaeum tengchongense]